MSYIKLYARLFFALHALHEILAHHTQDACIVFYTRDALCAIQDV